MQERLLTDVTLQTLLAQFVLIHFDVDDDEWQEWERRYPSEGRTMPILYVIRADGKAIHAKSGASEGPLLAASLANWLAEGGKLLSEAQLEKVQADVEKAAKAYGDGKVAEAAMFVVRSAGSGSYAEAAVRADELAKKLIDDGREKIKAADEKLAGDDRALEGAVELAAVARLYRKLPEVMKTLKQVTAQHRKDSAKRELFAQAALLDKAAALGEQKQTKQAASAYQQVVEKWPGTPAAELAQAGLDELSAKHGGDAAPADKPAGDTTAASDADSQRNGRKAASLLKLARSFAASKPEKARDYARQVIELVPGTDLAREAAALLNELP